MWRAQEGRGLSEQQSQSGAEKPGWGAWQREGQQVRGRGSLETTAWVPVRWRGLGTKHGGRTPRSDLFLPLSARLCALCKGGGAVSNANGENAVSGKCSLINNIKSSSLSAGDIPHFSSLCASPRHLMMWRSLWDVRSMLISPSHKMVGTDSAQLNYSAPTEITK